MIPIPNGIDIRNNQLTPDAFEDAWRHDKQARMRANVVTSVINPPNPDNFSNYSWNLITPDRIIGV